ncbi:MAG: DUF1496 domain-containing protein [Plesiomonas sp.]|uniref:DUF1496 domain-containing protein n=1 Tax=Plesiomonas sp. TaxID=2486279 RepID=UPI003F3BB9B2
MSQILRSEPLAQLQIWRKLPLFLFRHVIGTRGWRVACYCILLGGGYSSTTYADVVTTGVQGMQNSTVFSTGNRNQMLSNNLIAADADSLTSTTEANTSTTRWGNSDRIKLNIDSGALMQGSACYYADQRYSEGALLDVGNNVMRCIKQKPEFNNSPLEWQIFKPNSEQQ